MLRHTYASRLIQAGVHSKVIAEQMGHTNARLVDTLYGHLAPLSGAQAARALDALDDTATAKEAQA